MRAITFGGVACLFVFACGDEPEPLTGPPDVIIDVSVDAGDAGDAAVTILSIDVSPLTLVPPFSPSITDYYVRCSAGPNDVTLTVTDTGGTQSNDLSIVEDQAIVVANQYWIRCLPHDFPTITVATHGTPSPGYYLINGTIYAAALDTNGTPVWYARGTSTVNVDSPTPNAISFMPNGTSPYGWASSTRFDIHALDTLTTTSVSAVGSPTDAHEFRLLPNGHHLLFTYPIETQIDLTGLSTFNANETMADCEIQELDAQNNLVWSWLGSDHVDPVQESIEPMVNTINGVSTIDPFHCNSIDVDSSGNLLVSFRHANALYYIDRSSGTVLWKLGGTDPNKDNAEHITVEGDSEGTFSMQHDARFTPTGTITMFDDHGGSAGVSRGVEYAIDFQNQTASVVWQFLGSGASQYEGSCRRQTDGHTVIGWGSVPKDPRFVTEVDESGNDVLDISLSGGASYRAVKVPISQLDIDLLRTTTAK